MRIVLAVAALLGACTDEAATIRAVEAQGFTDVETTGWAPWSCSDDDFFETGFTATNPAGQRVSGAVCCGFIVKSCTVRW